MQNDDFCDLICPLDGDALSQNGTVLACAAGHCFDIAREGYVNLLPVQHKRSLDPGDSKAMVQARRRFLNSGSYQPIADAIKAAVFRDAAVSHVLKCLDAGCGEGYYLRQLAAAGASHKLAITGVDISKWAVMAAAKQQRQATWVVASNANLPLLSRSVDRLVCGFGFPVYEEFRRVLKPEGRLILVEGERNHLQELREIVYPEVKGSGRAEDDPPAGFLPLSEEVLSFSLDLEGEQAIEDLFAMTPHFYRANADGRAHLSTLSRLAVTVDVKLTVYTPESVWGRKWGG